MITRMQRLDEFSQAAPPADQSVEVQYEDHAGAYLLPYPCRYVDGKWVRAERNTIIAVNVVGWRLAFKGYQNRRRSMLFLSRPRSVCCTTFNNQWESVCGKRHREVVQPD